MSARNRKPTQPGSGDAADEVTAKAPVKQGDAATDAASPNARKEPPPEKPADARRRTHVVLSFWALILSFGLPIWWHTTSIHRANLPLSDMMDWAEGRVCTDASSLLETPMAIASLTDSISSRRCAVQYSPSQWPSRRARYQTRRLRPSCDKHNKLSTAWVALPVTNCA